MFALESLQHDKPIFNVLQSNRRGNDALSIRAESQRQLLELRLDGLTSFEMRPKRGVDIGQLTDPLPYRDQPSERGIVAVVKRTVRFAAQALKLVGIGEHTARGIQLFIFTDTHSRTL